MNLSDFALECAIVDEYFGANLDSVGQLAVVGGDARRITLHRCVSYNHEGLALFELDHLAFFERPCEHGRTLGVKHDGQLLLTLRENSSQRLQRLSVRLLQFQSKVRRLKEALSWARF